MFEASAGSRTCSHFNGFWLVGFTSNLSFPRQNFHIQLRKEFLRDKIEPSSYKFHHKFSPA